MMLRDFLRDLGIISFGIQERRPSNTVNLVIDDCITVRTKYLDDLIPYLGFSVTTWRLLEDIESCEDRALILEITASSLAASLSVHTVSALQKSRSDLIIAVIDAHMEN